MIRIEYDLLNMPCLVPHSRPSGNLIKPMEMMDRPMAMADTEPVGGGDSRADPGLGVAYRGFQLLALGEAGGDG